MANVGTIKDIVVGTSLYSNGARKSKIQIKIETTTSWTLDSITGYYYHDFSISGVTANDHFIIEPDIENNYYQDILSEFSLLICAESSSDNIRIYRITNSAPARYIYLNLYDGGEYRSLTDAITGNTYNLGYTYFTITLPSTISWLSSEKYCESMTFNSTTGCDNIEKLRTMKAILQGYGGTIHIDPLITSASSKETIEEGWSHIFNCDIAFYSGRDESIYNGFGLKLYSDIDSPNIGGITLQIGGF